MGPQIMKSPLIMNNRVEFIFGVFGVEAAGPKGPRRGLSSYGGAASPLSTTWVSGGAL